MGQTLSGPQAVDACAGEAIAGADGAGTSGGNAGGPAAGVGSGGAGGQAGQPGMVRMSFSLAPPTTPAQPTPVPTLGQWSLLLLSFALAGLAALHRRREGTN
jgi:hypothetical protein